MDKPDTVINVVPLMLDMPLMLLVSSTTSSLMMEPGASGLKVFFINMGMCLMQTGYMVGGYTTLAPKLHSSIASM